MRTRVALLWALLAGVVSLASVAFLTFRDLQNDPLDPVATASGRARPGALEIGQAAADGVMQWVLPDLAGGRQAMAQWRQKVLVVNFWASWCAPCVEEMPAFSRLHERYSAQGVQFVGIGMDEMEHMQRFVRARSVSYPLLAATPAVSETPGLPIGALPLTLVLDRGGRLAMSHLGRLDEGRLEPVLQGLLNR